MIGKYEAKVLLSTISLLDNLSVSHRIPMYAYTRQHYTYTGRLAR
jgi:hypothetical protein